MMSRFYSNQFLISRVLVIFLIFILVCLKPLYYFKKHMKLTVPFDTDSAEWTLSAARFPDGNQQVRQQAVSFVDPKPGFPEMNVQENPLILDIMKKYYLIPPSTNRYNLNKPFEKDPSNGQSKEVMKILGNKINGFFVEGGAFNGENKSNTLFMERVLGWKGILIEPRKKNFENLITKNRKAWSSNTCLSSKPIPEMNLFHEKGTFLRIRNKSSSYYVQCFPFYSYLLALNVTTVDYFSLDIEGMEINVLNTIPFDRVFIKVISMEDQNKGYKELEYTKFMEDRGFVFVKAMKLSDSFSYIFKHTSA